ncbi:Rho GTPase-activating protein 1 [Balamuthia mandrillaris]
MENNKKSDKAATISKVGGRRRVFAFDPRSLPKGLNAQQQQQDQPLAPPEDEASQQQLDLKLSASTGSIPVRSQSSPSFLQQTATPTTTALPNDSSSSSVSPTTATTDATSVPAAPPSHAAVSRLAKAQRASRRLSMSLGKQFKRFASASAFTSTASTPSSSAASNAEVNNNGNDASPTRKEGEELIPDNSTNATTGTTAANKAKRPQYSEYRDMLQAARTQDFSDLDPYHLVYKSGKDVYGRTVIVMAPANMPIMPDSTALDLDRMLLYLIKTMDQVVEKEYCLVFCVTNMTNAHRPGLAWFRRAYNFFNRKYKKNLKALYIVHPTWFVKATLKLCKPFISNKFWKKLVYIDNVTDIYQYIKPDQISFPDFVLSYRRRRGDFARPIFGVPLEEAVIRTTTHSGLPVVCERAFQALDAAALETEGLFRISGSNADINDLKKRFDRGEDVDLIGWDPHVVAGLLKLFLREMPEPLFTHELYDEFIKLLADPSTAEMQEATATKLRELLASLPMHNFLLCRRLFKLLMQTAAKSEVNKMGSSNLAIVFGPNLMRAPKGADENRRLIMDTATITRLIVLLIEHYNVLLRGLMPKWFAEDQQSSSTIALTFSDTTSVSNSSSVSNTPESSPRLFPTNEQKKKEEGKCKERVEEEDDEDEKEEEEGKTKEENDKREENGREEDEEEKEEGKRKEKEESEENGTVEEDSIKKEEAPITMTVQKRRKKKEKKERKAKGQQGRTEQM